MTIVNGYCTLADVKRKIQTMKQGTISAFSDNGSGGTTASDLGHTLSDSQLLFLSDATDPNYNGAFTIFNVIKGQSFDIDATFGATDTASYTSSLEHDEDIEGIITTVSRQIDEDRRTRFYTASESRVYSPKNADLVYINDIVSITSIETDDNFDGTYPTTWLASDYFLEPFNAVADSVPFISIHVNPFTGTKRFPYISHGHTSSYGYSSGYYNSSYGHGYLPSGHKRISGNTTASSFPSIRVTGDFGYSVTAPESIKQATILVSVQTWRRRDTIFNVSGGSQMKKEEFIRNLIKTDPQIRGMIEKVLQRPSQLNNG